MIRFNWILLLWAVFFCMNLHAQEIDKDVLDKTILKANNGDLRSQVELGDMLRETNVDEAQRWYRKAGEQNYVPAQLVLGRMFYRTKDHGKSIEWFKKAAIQGDSKGQKWMGHAYYLGPDKYKNYELAKKWYGKAAAQGNTEAKLYLKAISERKSESAQAIDALLFLLLLFPVWWLVVGYFFNYSAKPIGIILTVVFTGGVIGFMIAFSCNGGAGGSSQMSGSAWGCLSPYLVIYHIILLSLIFSKKREIE
ncbi:MAG: tetratricopeptide repeat protein [Campylobacterota bacterium]|nr:tetratricopeptide repeat protein [Campylobacterota bacterium]